VAEPVKKPEALDAAAQALPSAPAVAPVADVHVAAEPVAQPEHKAVLQASNEQPALEQVAKEPVANLVPQNEAPAIQRQALQTPREQEPSENPAPSITPPVVAAVAEPVAAPAASPVVTAIAPQQTAPNPVAPATVDSRQAAMAQVDDYPLSSLDNDRWLVLCNALPISGLLATVAANSILEENDGKRLLFRLEKGHDAVYDPAYQQRLADALGEHFKQPLQVEIVIGQVSIETPYLYRLRKRAERQALAVQTLRDDPVAKALEERFSATLDEASVVPLD